MSGIRYRLMRPGEEKAVCVLVERVFNELVAPDYKKNGIEEFFKYTNPEALAARRGPDQFVVLAEEEGRVGGMIEIRGGDHIALFFVERRGEGISRGLLDLALKECRRRKNDLTQITVNSSLFAEPIYRRLGFESSGGPHMVNGILFVPMTLRLETGPGKS